LVGYIVEEEGKEVKEEEVERRMRERMPEYMVPVVYVKMERMPMSGSGKVDRRSLPRPGRSRRTLSAEYAPPQTMTEQAIAEIWKDVLRVDQVGIKDNFFDLGGHSLLMVQVHSRLRESFDRELSLIEMFRYTTIEALASRLNHQSIESSSP